VPFIVVVLEEWASRRWDSERSLWSARSFLRFAVSERSGSVVDEVFEILETADLGMVDGGLEL
jgi:hypothetical protein